MIKSVTVGSEGKRSSWAIHQLKQQSETWKQKSSSAILRSQAEALCAWNVQWKDKILKARIFQAGFSCQTNGSLQRHFPMDTAHWKVKQNACTYCFSGITQVHQVHNLVVLVSLVSARNTLDIIKFARVIARVLTLVQMKLWQSGKKTLLFYL